ncbi:metal ABC transporter permease [bacterium]|nr:metal ABC transporter permease [bacterium]
MDILLGRVAFWTMLIGMVAGTSCSVVGCYLVLRRMSLLGDAISHAVLPGIAIGVLMSGQIGGIPSIIGALVFGLLTTLLIEVLHGQGRLTEDSSIGVVFSSLFSIGVIIITREARHKHIDTDCILYGLIEAAPLDLVTIVGFEIPRVMLTLVPVMLVILSLVFCFWKEFKIASFDPVLATAMGISATLVHYLLMSMVAAVTVSSFEAVGSILVIAMLIVPAATAHLLTDRLISMMLVAVAVSWISSVLGYWIAAYVNTSVAGMIAVIAGGQFLLAVLFSPKYGLVSRAFRNGALAVRIMSEDILARLYRLEEKGDSLASSSASHSGAGVVLRWWSDFLLRRQGLVSTEPTGKLSLTESGRHRARELVRAHRLWESYLGENFNLAPDHLHDAAERMEHFIGPKLQERITEELRERDSDPHGRPIPPQ